MQRNLRFTPYALSLFILTVGISFAGFTSVHAEDGKTASASRPDDTWRQSVKLCSQGEFERAGELLSKVNSPIKQVSEVRGWLDEFEKQQKARKEIDGQEFEKYVGYAKARIERKEHTKALDQAIKAADVASDRDAMLDTDWMRRLVNDSLEAADKFRKEHEWRDAWHIYADLGVLYDREPRYEKLENEVLTHLRLDAMFGEKSNWKERIERVQWRDAEAALEHIEYYYVETPDFKAITEAGLEQMLLLAESKSAQKTFEGLADVDERNDFEVRIGQHLGQVRNAPRVDRKECVRRFRRAIRINKDTVQLPEELVVKELMAGSLEPLDDFTSVIWPSATEDFDKHTRGDYIGVGISIVKNQLDEIEVVTPMEDAPAFRAGVQAGDVITAVDGVSIKGYSTSKVVDTITGPRDTQVVLTIRRGTENIDFDLARKTVKIQSVKGWERKPDETWDYWRDKERGIAYIRVTNFQRNTVEDLENVVAELKPQGLKGLILDLRWNPGGLLDQAWRMSALFLKDGDKIVSTKGRNPREDQVLDSPGMGALSDLPLVVLVNDSSASASEIVSGAIRDNKRGVVIGERTFGKFSVQNLIQLSSSQAKLKLTTARYYLPSGVSLHRHPGAEKWGVDPDVAIRLGRWESYNAWQGRREMDMLGPKKPEAEKKDDDEKVTDAKDEDNEAGDAKEKDGKDSDGDEKVADATEKEEDKLPKLDQPDENGRPKDADPQVDTALLFLRVKLVAERYPTLAAADVKESPNQNKPVEAKP